MMMNKTATTGRFCVKSQQIRPIRKVAHIRSKIHAQGGDIDDKEPSAPKPSLANPVETIQWGGTLPSPRRLLLSGAAATSIVLFGNLFGFTSALLSLDDGNLASSARLDVLIPVKGLKRCVDYQNGFEFQYPAKWLADQSLYRRYAARIERETSLDLPSPRQMAPRKMRLDDVPEPSAAFGPPGSTGEENISVIVAPIRDGFKLENMGSPTEAAQRFLDTTVAPPGSDRTAVLLSARSKTATTTGDDQLYYIMEFTVSTPKFDRHDIAVYGARNGLLYTMNCQCPEKLWEKEGGNLSIAADSFRIINSGAGALGFQNL